MFKRICATLALASCTASAQPINNDCLDALIIPSEGGVISVDFDGATPNVPGPSCGGDWATVWYSYTPDQDGYVDFSTCGSQTFTAVSIWSDCGTELSCNAQDFNCPGDNAQGSIFNWPVFAGQEILVAVKVLPYQPATNTVLSVNAFLGGPPANDMCATATPIFDGLTDATNAVAPEVMSDGPLSCLSFTVGGHDVWYSYTATCTGTVSADFIRGSVRTMNMEVYEACGGAPIACIDGIFGETRIQFASVAGTTYLLRCASLTAADSGGFEPSIGDFQIAIECDGPPANDACAGATPIGLGETVFNNQSAQVDQPAPPCVSEDEGDLYFSFTVPQDTYISTEYNYYTLNGNSGTPGSLSVYDACGGALIECDGPSMFDDRPNFEFAALANQTYIIRVASKTGTTRGDGLLRLLDVPFPEPNDECAGAAPIGLGTHSFDNFGGIYTSDDPLSCFGSPIPQIDDSLWNKDQWFAFTPDETKAYAIAVSETWAVELYDICGGAALACSLSPAYFSDGTGASELCIEGVAGQTYLVRVGRDFFQGRSSGRLRIREVGSFDFAVPAMATSEDEICGDQVNQGCQSNGTNLGMDPLALGEARQGEVGFELSDRDVMSLQLEDGKRYRLEGQALGTRNFVIRYSPNCPDGAFVTMDYTSESCRVSFDQEFVANRGTGRYVLIATATGVEGCLPYWVRVSEVDCTGDIADVFGTLGGDGQVSFGDFLALLGLVGPCPGGTPGCIGDIADDFGVLGGDGQVSFGDFLALLGLVGPCQ